MPDSPLTPQEEAELSARIAKSKSPEATQFQEDFKSNPEVAETPYGKGEQQGMEHPATDPTELAIMMMNPGALLSKGLIGAAEKTGLAQIPGRLMASAVGTKYAPKVGSELVSEGLVGTRGMLQNQVEKGLATHGAKLESAVSQIPGKIESAPVSQKVAEVANKFKTPGGTVPANFEPEVQKVVTAASDIAGRGAVEPSEALALKRLGGKAGWSRDKPLSSLEALIGRAESGGYGSELEGAYGKAFPEAPNAVSSANSRLSALIKANSSMAKQAPPNVLADIGESAIKGGIAGVVGGKVPGVAVGLGSMVAKSPFTKSVAAQGLSKTGQAIASRQGSNVAAYEMLHAAGSADQMSHTPTADRLDTALTPEEEAELTKRLSTQR